MFVIFSFIGFIDIIVCYVVEQFDEFGVFFEMICWGIIWVIFQGCLNILDCVVFVYFDMIGVLVCEIKFNGCFGLVLVGCWLSCFVEGSWVMVFIEQGVFCGSVLLLLVLGYVFNIEVDNLKISWDNIELCFDVYIVSCVDSESLGILVGDYVVFDLLLEFIESGYISVCYLDDKVGVVVLLVVLKVVKESGQELLIDCYLLFIIIEEVGFGVVGVLFWDVSEFVGIDIVLVVEGQNFNEYSVSVVMQDFGGFYDFYLLWYLLWFGECYDIVLCCDLFCYYYSDVQLVIVVGYDICVVLLVFGCDVIYGYECMYIDSFVVLSCLFIVYIFSLLVFVSDVKFWEILLECFNKQFEYLVYMESCIYVLLVDEVFDSSNNSDKG